MPKTSKKPLLHPPYFLQKNHFFSFDVNTNVFSADGTTKWSNADNLQYVVCQGSDNNASKNFSVDDIKYYSGEATPAGTAEFSDTFTSTYPNLPNGAIFEESDTGKHYMFDGTSTWNEIA